MLSCASGTGKGRPNETDGPVVAEGLGGCNIKGVDDSKTKTDISKEDTSGDSSSQKCTWLDERTAAKSLQCSKEHHQCLHGYKLYLPGCGVLCMLIEVPLS